MTVKYILDQLKKIDSNVKFSEHPSIPYALLLTPSEPKYLGDLLYIIEINKCAGILLEVINCNKSYQLRTMIEITPLKLNWKQKLARWLCK